MSRPVERMPPSSRRPEDARADVRCTASFPLRSRTSDDRDTGDRFEGCRLHPNVLWTRACAGSTARSSSLSHSLSHLSRSHLLRSQVRRTLGRHLVPPPAPSSQPRPYEPLGENPMIPPRSLLTTREAATHCGHKDPSAIRRAVHNGKLMPSGRRSGQGRVAFHDDELDRFIRGELPVLPLRLNVPVRLPLATKLTEPKWIWRWKSIIPPRAALSGNWRKRDGGFSFGDGSRLRASGRQGGT